jgi:hypothetical protein
MLTMGFSLYSVSGIHRYPLRLYTNRLLCRYVCNVIQAKGFGHLVVGKKAPVYVYGRTAKAK